MKTNLMVQIVCKAVILIVVGGFYLFFGRVTLVYFNVGRDVWYMESQYLFSVLLVVKSLKITDVQYCSIMILHSLRNDDTCNLPFQVVSLVLPFPFSF